MTPTRRLLPAAALLALAACQSTTATPAAGARAADAEFITSAYQIIKFDREEGEIAQKQAESPQVRAIAARLAQQANQYESNLAPVARQLGVKPPATLRYDLRTRLAHMRLQPGLNFDRNYLDDQIASHEEASRNVGMMNPQEYSEPLMGLAKRGLALVEQNLADLRALRRQMGAPAS